MNKTSRATDNGKAKGKNKAKAKKSNATGPIAFFVSLFIIALGAIQLVSTFHTYALNLAELNSLKREEASLVAKKQELENNIKRWDDKAYVTAQARERLGFVFPDEQAVRVLHPEAVTGDETPSDQSDGSQTTSKKVLPWYSELAYSFKKADEPVSEQSTGQTSGSADSSDSDDANQEQGTDGNSSASSSSDATNDQNTTGEGTQQ
ncbi:septum formation initiator [Bifidobacterium sp. UTBIF-68]|uniref:FtsB family cell division protein n=1 Tax=Bifidobacterium sp. UTBIF-68 TaxID=1465262 RepID=UPI00112D7A41|nr:septum formation initiator family protein [Bifidobacterium sp. UTBIF-68]TPF93306.1 septum formation initiator [Bifidobacterium sp. UTBIF-68]